MQLHHAMEYNMFERLVDEAKFWVEVAAIGPVLLTAAVVVVPAALALRAVRYAAKEANRPYWFEPASTMECGGEVR